MLMDSLLELVERRRRPLRRAQAVAIDQAQAHLRLTGLTGGRPRVFPQARKALVIQGTPSGHDDAQEPRADAPSPSAAPDLADGRLLNSLGDVQ